MLVLQPWKAVEAAATRHVGLRVLTWDGYERPPEGALLEQVEFFAPPLLGHPWGVIACMSRLRILQQLDPDQPVPYLPDHIAVYGAASGLATDLETDDAQGKTLLLMQLERLARGLPLYLPVAAGRGLHL